MSWPWSKKEKILVLGCGELDLSKLPPSVTHLVPTYQVSIDKGAKSYQWGVKVDSTNKNQALQEAIEIDTTLWERYNPTVESGLRLNPNELSILYDSLDFYIERIAPFGETESSKQLVYTLDELKRKVKSLEGKWKTVQVTQEK